MSEVLTKLNLQRSVWAANVVGAVLGLALFGLIHQLYNHVVVQNRLAQEAFTVQSPIYRALDPDSFSDLATATVAKMLDSNANIVVAFDMKDACKKLQSDFEFGRWFTVSKSVAGQNYLTMQSWDNSTALTCASGMQDQNSVGKYVVFDQSKIVQSLKSSGVEAQFIGMAQDNARNKLQN